ncbi:glycosyltransferase [Desulfosarcina sp. OttesenSCG-928-G10]|nr:glycosyltransferase [Desulfosarcina sp. OttesenSCG-928-G10]
MTFLFWLSAILLIYPLFLYPLLLALPWGRRRSAVRSHFAEVPHVSMLLSVFNEKDVIAQKINNFLALDYPLDRLELIIVSDGSDDGTDDIVGALASERIRLLRQEGRGGKTLALNRAAKEARGDILFFTDADSMLKNDCITQLTAFFADPDVGLVSGRSVYVGNDGRETTGSLYRRYEEWLKEREGRRYGIAGADGAVYALRKELYRPLPSDIINDLVHPIQVVLAGKRALAHPDALVCEPGEEGNAEFSRQTRIMAQSWHVFLHYVYALVKEKRHGFLWQFISHKILRWIALPLLFVFAISALALPGVIPGFGLSGAIVGFVLAGFGNRAGTAGRVCRLFVLQSAAGIYGLFRLWRGASFVTWKPRQN